MSNQEIRLSRQDTLNLRKNIDTIETYLPILQKKLYTPTKEALENFMSLNTADSRENIINLSTRLDTRLLDIENDYVTNKQAAKIAEDAVIIFGG